MVAAVTKSKTSAAVGAKKPAAVKFRDIKVLNKPSTKSRKPRPIDDPIDEEEVDTDDEEVAAEAKAKPVPAKKPATKKAGSKLPPPKPRKYPAIHNKMYKVEHVLHLIGKAVAMKAYRDQWNYDSMFTSGADAHQRLVCLVELLESIVVFNIGDGMNNFKSVFSPDYRALSHSVDLRLKSFVDDFGYAEEKAK